MIVGKSNAGKTQKMIRRQLTPALRWVGGASLKKRELSCVLGSSYLLATTSPLRYTLPDQKKRSLTRVTLSDSAVSAPVSSNELFGL